MDYNVLQVGLTAVMYIDEGWRPEKREAMANAIERYIAEFGNKLKWGFLGDVNKPEQFILPDILSRKKRLSALEDDTADIQWSSEYYKDYVSDYQIRVYSPAGWYEHVHRRISYIIFFWPLSELKNNGRERFERLILDFCQVIQPKHGLAGLGTQQLYDDNPYQYLECEIAQSFTGIDITTSLTDKGLRNGIRSVNWYTILSNEWLKRFDVEPSVTQPLTPPQNPVRISAKSGDICPCSGHWVTLAGGHQEFVDIQAGAVMPEATKYQSNMYAPEVRIPAIWNLLSRDDGESVYTDTEVN